MHKFTFLDNTANFVLNYSFVETHHPSPWLSDILFERMFLPESDKLQNQYNCFPQAWVLNGGYYNWTFCIAYQYPAFSLVDYPLYV